MSTTKVCSLGKHQIEVSGPTAPSLAGARLLRERGATIYVVGVDKKGPINMEELEVIAGHSSRVYTIYDIAQLQEELRSLSQLCLRTSKVKAL
ncbi:hypothetical protein Y032_0029g1880 [Ancylostoma ceylanicum]|uniref:Uncharacterized protein n=1 Tax=Ancylostoma ceylanicum TaxID=53326 RepID=A0A016URG9_9BILA|nr:hypothetical protein Y032_0029g1880 [Ancylostoma ceylanicum]